MTIKEILAEAGITRESEEYGLQYNLCHAAIHGALGIRNGSTEAVKEILERHNLAKFDPEKVLELRKLLIKMLIEL